MDNGLKANFSERDLVFHSVYMNIAKEIATLSYCKKRQVGAVIVQGGNILSYGFNGSIRGMPNVCEDGEGKTLPNVVHAEVNALLKACAGVNGADAYVTLFPCNECAKLMAQAGIKRLFYLEDHKTDLTRLYGITAYKIS